MTVVFTKSSLLKQKGKIVEKKPLLLKKFLKKSVILFIYNIYTGSARQEPVENPKQSRAKDFPHLPPNQTIHLPRWRRLFSFTLPKHFYVFFGKICCNETTASRDLLQRDDSIERSDATRRRRREICPAAMDLPSMVRVFAADESV
ncbi:uncharacterized protein G2W53_014935 [Senna tora]|uniref:Uncharacterized protein n=1 Tax=Senna tora TaxID=362788 RepID=A0A834WUK0_9FABA|nr:uncharacterized protein G2W53_014935 [Senna tora]